MIYLKKSGIFYENRYSPKSEEYVYEEVGSVIPYLNEEIDIEENFTLLDFFNIIEKDKETMQIVFESHLGSYPLQPFIDEVNRDCLEESKEDLDYIECCWFAEQFDYKLFYDKCKNSKIKPILGPLKEPLETDINEISIGIIVHGWGKSNEQEGDPCYHPDITHMGYAIEFTPLYRLAHLPIKLNRLFEMTDRNEVGIDAENVVVGEKSFSVFEIFGEILSELTFCGLPDERDARWRDILDIKRETEERFKEKEEDEQ